MCCPESRCHSRRPSHASSSKYGNVHKQLRALTILDGLIENAGPRFQRAFADEPLLERLRVAATDSISDPEVKQKCSILFRQWAASYAQTPGLQRVAALHKQLPQRKKAPSKESSRVLRESEPGENDDPFGTSVAVSGGGAPMQSLRSPTTSTSASSSTNSGPSLTPHGQQPSVSNKVSKTKKPKPAKPFNLEKEKPQLLQAIASSSVASTNLMNSLKLINRESKRVSEDPETVQRFETCKLLRRQVLRYIQNVESEQWLGSLIHANESLVEALMAFEVMDKDLEDDSDSEAHSDDEVNEWDSDEAEPVATNTKKGKGGVQNGLSGLSLSDRMPAAKPPDVMVNGGKRREDSESEDDDNADDDNAEDDNAEDDNPFGDINAVNTPKEERPGMTW